MTRFAPLALLVLGALTFAVVLVLLFVAYWALWAHTVRGF